MDRLTLKFVWKLQKETPVVLRRTGKSERLRVKLPYADDNRQWLRNGRRTSPAWFDSDRDRPGYWELPKAWFNDFVDRALMRYGKVYIIQPYRAQEICSAACPNAVGHECQCSCMGEHHGAGNDGSWFEVSETFSTRWGERELACRLLTARCCARQTAQNPDISDFSSGSKTNFPSAWREGRRSPTREHQAATAARSAAQAKSDNRADLAFRPCFSIVFGARNGAC